MKKVLFFLALFLPSFLTSAQERSIPKYVYCEINGLSSNLGASVKVEIDDGQYHDFVDDRIIKDVETGKPRKFNSMIDALNYMSELGWEFVQAFVVVETDNRSIIHWLLKRKLTEEETKNYISLTGKASK